MFKIGRKGESLEIIIRTYSNRIVFKDKVNLNHYKELENLFKILENKFNIFSNINWFKEDRGSWWE